MRHLTVILATARKYLLLFET